LIGVSRRDNLPETSLSFPNVSIEEYLKIAFPKITLRLFNDLRVFALEILKSPLTHSKLPKSCNSFQIIICRSYTDIRVYDSIIINQWN